MHFSLPPALREVAPASAGDGGFKAIQSRRLFDALTPYSARGDPPRSGGRVLQSVAYSDSSLREGALIPPRRGRGLTSQALRAGSPVRGAFIDAAPTRGGEFIDFG